MATSRSWGRSSLRPSAAQPEAPGERVGLLHDEMPLAGVVRLASDLGDHGRMRPGPHRPDDLALEDAAGHAAEAAALAEPDPAAAVHERQPRADTGARGAAVDLAVGEDADIGRGFLRPVVRTIGQDGAVEE